MGNLQHAGYYRVDYDSNNWMLLMKQLDDNFELIPAIHRAQLLDDAFNLGKADLIDQLLFLNMSRYLVKENEFQPFTAAFHGLDYIAEMLLRDYFAFERFKVDEKMVSFPGLNSSLFYFIIFLEFLYEFIAA